MILFYSHTTLQDHSKLATHSNKDVIVLVNAWFLNNNVTIYRITTKKHRV